MTFLQRIFAVCREDRTRLLFSRGFPRRAELYRQVNLLADIDVNVLILGKAVQKKGSLHA